MATALGLVQTTDRNVNQLQQNIKQAIQPILSNPLMSGNLLQGVTLATGANNVPHGLNRNLIGWFLTRASSAASVYDTQDSNASPATYLQLVASAGITVDIYVF